MNGEAIVAVSAAVVGLTQIVKWSGLPDKWGPIVVLMLAGIGTAMWGYSQGDFSRATSFQYFAGWVAVALTAAGIFGFTRAAVASVTTFTPPPSSGAGSSPTVKE